MTSRAVTFIALSALVFAGCAVPSSEAPSSSTDDVVGVEDLASVEAEFRFVKDVRGPAGFSRSDAKLAAGDCYRKSIAAQPNWEFRRYTDGAAFFAKRGLAPGLGDSRALVCVDLDLDPASSISIEGFALDSAVRYHLGRPRGTDAGMMHVALSFERGHLYGQAFDAYCGVRDLTSGEGPPAIPAINAGVDAYFRCHQGGGVDSACQSAAQKACVDTAKSEAATLMLGRPTANGIYVSSLNAGGHELDASIAAVAARFAATKAKSADIFNMRQDPIGTLESVDRGEPGSGWAARARFSRLDVHHFVSPSKELVVITPKSSDRDPVANAVAICTRATGSAVDFDCEAPGKPLAP